MSKVNIAELKDGQKVKFILRSYDEQFKDLIGKEFVGNVVIDEGYGTEGDEAVITIMFWSNEEAMHVVFPKETELIELVND